MSIDDFIKRLPKHDCELRLTHNANRVNYMTVEEWLENLGNQGPEWGSDDERILAIKTNEIWELTWYPDTPVGGYSIAAPTLSRLLDLAQAYDDDIAIETRPE